MKKLFMCAVVLALLTAGSTAFAVGVIPEDMSWWGNTGATPLPYKDEVRAGYWWWPLEAASNANDSELWGNRGIVYAMYEPKKEKETVVDVPKGDPVVAKRQKPAYAHVLFDFDKAVLKPEGKVETDKVVADLKAHGKDTIVLEGHTCNVGADDYNMGLGQRRADSVKAYLVEQGIDAGRITTKSLGETQPAVPNDTPANRKLNRRVMFDTTVVD
jgi:outer membrane protein OmpA-like peptidoglycan-associated protein